MTSEEDSDTPKGPGPTSVAVEGAGVGGTSRVRVDPTTSLVGTPGYIVMVMRDTLVRVVVMLASVAAVASAVSVASVPYPPGLRGIVGWPVISLAGIVYVTTSGVANGWVSDGVYVIKSGCGGAWPPSVDETSLGAASVGWGETACE